MQQFNSEYLQLQYLQAPCLSQLDLKLCFVTINMVLNKFPTDFLLVTQQAAEVGTLHLCIMIMR